LRSSVRELSSYVNAVSCLQQRALNAAVGEREPDTE
jgi:hypothetical protein